VVCSAVEHHAVLDSVAWTASQGADVVLVPVEATGQVDLSAMRDAVTATTAVVSVMWANNEVGTVEPVGEVAVIASRSGALSHSDAVQAVGHVEVDFAASGLDLLSVAAHKLGGPQGVGALLARRGIELTPLLHGGGQERDVRSGTVAVAAIAGFAAAVDAAVEMRERVDSRLRALRTRLVEVVLAAAPDAVVNTPRDVDTLPGILNVTFPGCQGDAMLMLLDAAGIDCATGSACSAGMAQASHVLAAMGRTERDARSSLRFSLGHTTREVDLDRLAAALPETLDRARRAGSLTG
jgi:cysteine desulfurase